MVEDCGRKHMDKLIEQIVNKAVEVKLNGGGPIVSSMDQISSQVKFHVTKEVDKRFEEMAESVAEIGKILKSMCGKRSHSDDSESPSWEPPRKTRREFPKPTQSEKWRRMMDSALHFANQSKPAPAPLVAAPAPLVAAPAPLVAAPAVPTAAEDSDEEDDAYLSDEDAHASDPNYSPKPVGIPDNVKIRRTRKVRYDNDWWRNNYNKLAEYVKTTGRYPKYNATNKSMYNWVQYQRHHYTLYRTKFPDRYELLAKIPNWQSFVGRISHLMPKNLIWAEKFGTLKSFVEKYKEWPTRGSELGRWVQQKLRYAKNHPKSGTIRRQLDDMSKLPGWLDYIKPV